jgi:hypothetical protein
MVMFDAHGRPVGIITLIVSTFALCVITAKY